MLRNKLLCGTSVAVLMVLSSAAMAADIDISSTGTTAYSGTPTASSVNFTADGTLNVGSGASLSGGNGGTITTSTDNQGTVNFLGNSNLFASVGASGYGLKALNINGGTVVLDNADNSTWVATTTVNTGGTLSICNSTSTCSTATINGNVVLNGGTLALLATHGTNLTLGAGPGSSAENFTTTSGSTIVTRITGDGNTSGAGSTNLGHITASGAVTLATGTTVTADLSSYSAISNGARYILASGGSAATVGTITTTNTGLYTWQVLRGDAASLGQNADDVYLIANRISLGNVVGSSGGIGGGNAASVASVMDGLANSNNAQAQAVNTQLGALATSSPSAIQSALKSMAPDVTGGAVQAN